VMQPGLTTLQNTKPSSISPEVLLHKSLLMLLFVHLKQLK
jgi:hypothetical protein